MKLGLESLKPAVASTSGSVDISDCFYPLMLVAECDHVLQELTNRYEVLDTISNTIKQYGVTESLSFMYGENFSGSSSMESETEEAKHGVLRRIWETIKRWLANIVRFVRSLFNRTSKIIARLEDIKKNAGAYEFPISVYTIGTRFSGEVVKRDVQALFDEMFSKDEYNAMSASERAKMFSDFRRELHDKYIDSVSKKLTLATETQLSAYVDELLSLFHDIEKWKSNVKDISIGDAETGAQKVRIVVEKALVPISCFLLSKIGITIFHHLNSQLKKRSDMNE